MELQLNINEHLEHYHVSGLSIALIQDGYIQLAEGYGVLEGSGQQVEISSLGWGEGFQCMLVSYPYIESGVVMMINTNSGVHQLKGVIGEILTALTPHIRSIHC